MKCRNFAHSGFWRWYTVSRRDKKVADDGTRRVSLSVPAYEDRLGIEVSVAPDDTVRSVSACLSMSWIREDSPTSAAAVVCVSSLLRALEPDDAFVCELSAALLANVGLGTPREVVFDSPKEIAVEAVADALLGRTEGLEVSLAQGTLLRVLAGPDAVVIEWLAAPIEAAARRLEHLERPVGAKKSISVTQPTRTHE